MIDEHNVSVYMGPHKTDAGAYHEFGNRIFFCNTDTYTEHPECSFSVSRPHLEDDGLCGKKEKIKSTTFSFFVFPLLHMGVMLFICYVFSLYVCVPWYI